MIWLSSPDFRAWISWLRTLLEHFSISRISCRVCGVGFLQEFRQYDSEIIWSSKDTA